MSVSSISSNPATAAQRVTSASGSGSSKPSAIAAAVEEATESKATTIKEAQTGDRVAQRKIRALEAKQKQAAPPKAAEPGKGAAVDHDA